MVQYTTSSSEGPEKIPCNKEIIKSAYLCSRKFNSIIVMTAVDIRAAINNDLNTFSMDMLQVVTDYVRSMRKKRDEEDVPITPLVASMFT